MGKPIPSIPLFVIDAEGKETEIGVEGDIAVLAEPEESSTSSSFFGLFDGYIDQDGHVDRRIRSFKGKEGSSSQWYLTGDRATRDADGYFWFVGRADDVINSSGYRIGECIVVD